MNRLAIDVSTSVCSLALQSESGCQVFHERIDRREHHERLLPLVDGLLQKAGISVSELTALYFGRGPGSFTGVRLAASFVQGLAFDRTVSVFGASSLWILAESVKSEHMAKERVVLAPASQKEWYVQGFQQTDTGVFSPKGEPALVPNLEALSAISSETDIILSGECKEEISEALQARFQPARPILRAWPQASVLFSLPLTPFASMEEALPCYIHPYSKPLETR